MTTVSGWWGDEWITDGGDVLYENNKRVSFLEFAELPRHTDQALELALCLGINDREAEVQPVRESRGFAATAPAHIPQYAGDAYDRALLESHGWRVRHAQEVAGSPEAYGAYIQRSRAEFSAVKPSCLRFQNAWVSDRSLCYLASGKPVLARDTGLKDLYPVGEPVLLFSTLEEAIAGVEEISGNYRRHACAARAIAEEYFDSDKVLSRLLAKLGVA